MTIIYCLQDIVHEKYLCILMYKYAFVNACIKCTNNKVF